MARTKDPSAATRKAWVTRKRGSVREREQGLAGPVSSTEDLKGGVATTFKVTLEDGTVGNFKLDEKNGIGTPEHEVGAWEVAKLVGMEDMVPPAIVRVIDNPRGREPGGPVYEIGTDGWQRKVRRLDGGVPGDPSKMRGSFAAWQAGMTAGRAAEPLGDSQHDVMRAAMFDFVVGNEDRHPGNWVVADGEIKLIDHNRAFTARNGNASSFLRYMMNQERSEGRSLPPAQYAQAYLDRKAHILGALAKAGLKDREIDAVEQRIDWAATAQSWEDLGSY